MGRSTNVVDVDDVAVVDDDAAADDDDDVDELREKHRHPFAQTNGTGNLTKHFGPAQSKRTFPGSTSVLAVNNI